MINVEVNGQRFLNERFTCESSASSCDYLASFSTDGGFLMAGNAFDSTTGIFGIYIERRDKNTSLIKHNFFNIPDYATRYLYSTRSSIAKINDNKFVIVGTTEKAGCCKLGFILEVDSNCEVKHYEDIMIPFCGKPDSFMYSADVKYDGNGNLLILNHVECPTDYIQVLMKYDTSYHQLWAKQYAPFALTKRFSNGLIIEDDGYTIFGGAWIYTETDPGYHSQSTMFKVDTGGNLLWSYTSPSWEWNSIIFDAIKTKDGGYVYLANGNTVNTSPTGSTKLYLMSKNIMVKLDASKKMIWKKELSNYYKYYYGLVNQKIVELDDSSLIIQRWDSDSIGKNIFDDYTGFQKFTKDGNSIWRKRFKMPMDTPVSASADMNDFIIASNGDLISGGYISDSRWKAPAPAQRAWIIKTDSNGCMGPGACEYVSIPQLQISNPGFKVFPNPATSSLTISGTFDAPTDIQFLDISGRLVQSVNFKIGAGPKTLDIESWLPGVYFYKSINSYQPINGKLIKL